jgi:hypothetical protein
VSATLFNLRDFTISDCRIKRKNVCRLFSQNGQVNEERSFTLSNMLDAVPPIGKDSAWMDEALRGLLEQPMQNFDSSFTPEVTNKLFRCVSFFFRCHNKIETKRTFQTFFTFLTVVENHLEWIWWH